MNQFLTLLLSMLISNFAPQTQITQPGQPTNGPGGMDYMHTDITIHDHGDSKKGYWLYVPETCNEPINVISFMHGYGAINPMIYGGWIKHLVKKNNVVIFPRYQNRILSPGPEQFAPNAAIALNSAKEELENLGINANWDNFSMVAHSYGGVVSADLATNYAAYEIPKPKAVMLCSPGTGPLKGGKLKSYEKMDADINLIVLVNNDDYVVGDAFGKLVYNTATNVVNRNFIRQFEDSYGDEKVRADHNQCYSLDEELDCGYYNMTSKRAKRISATNAIDFNGYWKIFDALRSYTFENENYNYCFGNTAEQKSLGAWSDGTPIKELKITTP